MTVPPKIAQNPIGMSSRDIGKLPLRAILETTGRKSAAAPMFCMKLEMHPTDAEMIVITRPSVRPPNFKILPAAWLIIDGTYMLIALDSRWFNPSLAPGTVPIDMAASQGARQSFT